MPIAEGFELEDWYPSEAAKRRFGSICRAVNEQGATVHLLGNEDAPLLALADADNCPAAHDEIVITIDEAKADWSAVTTAAALGTRFRIKGKKVTRAVLYRTPKSQHPAEKYLRSSSADINSIAQQLEQLAREVRKLTQKVTRSVTVCRNDELFPIAEKLRYSAELIDKRFRDLWRASNGYPPRLA